MALKCGGKLVGADHAYSVAVASVAGGVVPVVIDREAREPANEGERYTPERGNNDEADADAPCAGTLLEEAEVLKEQRELDECRRGEIRRVAEVEDMKKVCKLGVGNVE